MASAQESRRRPTGTCHVRGGSNETPQRVPERPDGFHASPRDAVASPWLGLRGRGAPSSPPASGVLRAETGSLRHESDVRFSPTQKASMPPCARVKVTPDLTLPTSPTQLSALDSRPQPPPTEALGQHPGPW